MHLKIVAKMLSTQGSLRDTGIGSLNHKLFSQQVLGVVSCEAELNAYF